MLNINNLKNDLNINEHYTLKETMATKTEIIDKINKDAENKKSINNKPMKINQILKIKLNKDDPSDKKKGKTPKFGWTDARNQSTHYKITPNNNIGIVCNEQSGVFGIDLDFYNKDGTPYDFDNCEFCKVFGLPEQFIERFGTFTQKTTNGGTHLLFQHQDGLRQSQNPILRIDTRGGNTNGYLVGYDSIVNGKKYTIELEQPIQPMPEDLVDFLKNVYWKHPNTTNSVKQNKDKKRRQPSAVAHHVNKQLECIYDYNIIPSELKKILKRLPNEYFTAPEKWLIFTSAMKQINQKEIWDEFSERYGGASYNKTENLKWWDSARNNFEDCTFFESLLKVAWQKDGDEGVWCKKMNEFLGMVKYKPLLPRMNKPDEFIDMNYLTGNKCGNGYKNGFNFNQGNMVIQSDTGTAKTSGFKNYIKNTNQNFISIVSRRILAVEQYNDLNKTLTGTVDYYEHGFPDSLHQGYITCLDSILKIESWADSEISNRVVFLDEFNSLVEYMLSSPTMDTKRVSIIEFVIEEIFMKAKQLICVDADISDLSMNFIKYIEEMRGDKFKYIVNKATHNKDVPAQEYFSKKDLVDRASKSPAFIFACDSKTEAIDIYKQLSEAQTEDEDEIVLIVARDDIPKAMEQYVNFSNIKKLIFSPKVIYGNDSVYPNGRDVFAYYLEHTISPTAFLQQINRERSINKLHYCFQEKSFCQSDYKTTKDVVDDVMELHQTSLERFEFSGKKEYQQMFLDLSVQLLYKKDAYDTNKYAHFQTLLPTRGFVNVIKTHKKTYKKSQEEQQEKDARVEEWKQEIWNAEDALNSRLNEDLLKIDNVEDIEEFKHLFLNVGAIDHHIMAIYYFLKPEEQIKFKIKLAKEYPLLKLQDKYCKLDTMISIMRECGYEKAETIKINNKGKAFGTRLTICQTTKVDISDELAQKFTKLYYSFYERSKKVFTADMLNEPHKFKQYSVEMIKKTCGNGFVRSQKVHVGVGLPKQMEYTFNESLIKLTDRIMNCNSMVKKEVENKRIQAEIEATWAKQDVSDPETVFVKSSNPKFNK